MLKLRARYLWLAMVFPLASFASGNTDILTHWQRERTTRLGADAAHAHTTAELVRQMLVDPASPYSDAVDAPAFTNEVDWPSFVDGLPGHAWTDADALAGLQRSLGVTRARPGRDVDVAAGASHPFVVAGMVKADVDPVIFWHMLDVMGYRYSSEAAVYAVGMEVLRRQIEATPEEERRRVLGIDDGVYERVMRAMSPGELRVYDTGYLTTLVQARLVHWTGGMPASQGGAALAMAYRVARVAAAYRDRQGYLSAPPCLPDGSPRTGAAGTGQPGDTRPLCFVAATDRAVHRWAMAEARRQARTVPTGRHATLGRWAALAALLPLLDIVAAVEFVEATLAEDLVAGGSIDTADAELAAERADTLSCRIP